MNRKKFLILCVLCVLCGKSLFAQTAEQLDAVLEADTVTYGQAAYFVMEGTSNAYQQAVEKGWLKAGTQDDPVTLAQLSFLMMQAFEMKGGLMYAIAPGPRYAYRSMVSRQYIQGASDPAMKVNGERFLLILGNVLSQIELEGEQQ